MTESLKVVKMSLDAASRGSVTIDGVEVADSLEAIEVHARVGQVTLVAPILVAVPVRMDFQGVVLWKHPCPNCPGHADQPERSEATL